MTAGLRCREQDSVYLDVGKRALIDCGGAVAAVVHSLDLTTTYGAGTRRAMCGTHAIATTLALAVNPNPGVRYRVTLETLPVYPSPYADDYSWWTR